MSLAEFESLTATVLVAILLLAAVLGFVMRETRFCTVGAISDVVYLQDWGRARQWGMAIAVAMLGFTVLALWGQVDVADSLYASRRLLWLSALVGGVLFGAGMVLASGCGARNLTRLGSGSLKALVVLLVMGVAAFATLKGITAVARVRWLDSVHLELNTLALLPEWLAAHVSWSVVMLRGVTGFGLGALLLMWAVDLRSGAMRSPASLIGGCWWACALRRPGGSAVISR